MFAVYHLDRRGAFDPYPTCTLVSGTQVHYQRSHPAMPQVVSTNREANIDKASSMALGLYRELHDTTSTLSTRGNSLLKALTPSFPMRVEAISLI